MYNMISPSKNDLRIDIAITLFFVKITDDPQFNQKLFKIEM